LRRNALSFLLLFTFLVTASPVSAKKRVRDLFGLKIGMSEESVHKKLKKIATQQKEEKEKGEEAEQEVWSLKKDDRFDYILTRFNRDHRLTPGLFVRLRLPGTAGYPGVLVEDRAIGTDLDRRFVLVVGSYKTVESRTVTLGPLVDGLRVVRKGLAAGELVVVNGLQRVRPGMQVDATAATMGGVQ